jgi:hypothetical protein
VTCSGIGAAYCVFPPTLTLGRLSWISPSASNRFREKLFGADVLPAKSGKNANSMEKLTKLSNTGAPADDESGTVTPLKPAGVPAMGELIGVSVVCGDATASRKTPDAKATSTESNRGSLMLNDKKIQMSLWKPTKESLEHCIV